MNAKTLNRKLQLDNLLHFLMLNMAVFTANPMIVSLRDELQALKDAFEDALERYLKERQPLLAEKQRKREELYGLARKLRNMLRMYAHRMGDASAEALLRTNSPHRAQNEFHFLHVVDELLAMAEDYGEDFRNWHGMADVIDDTTAQLTDYREWAYRPLRNRQVFSGTVKELQVLSATIQEKCALELDALMLEYADTHPDIYVEYRRSRRLPNLGSGGSSTASASESDMPSTAKSSGSGSKTKSTEVAKAS